MRLQQQLASSGIVIAIFVLSMLTTMPPALAATTVFASSQQHAATESDKVTLAEESIDGPALWSVATNKAPDAQSNTAVLAWTGIDRLHRLNVMTSLDGFHYANKLTIDEYSTHRPAVLQVTTSSGPVVVVAWTGTDQAHSLNILWNAYALGNISSGNVNGPQPQKILLGDNSPAAPALAYFDNKIWLAWTGTDPLHLLNVREFDITGQTLAVGPAVTINQFDSQGGPGLGVDAAHNQLLLTWTDTGKSHYLPKALPYINFLTSADGRTWNTVLVAPPPQTSNVGPNLSQSAQQGGYYWTWTGTDPLHSLNLATTTTINNWPAPITTFAEECTGSPAPGMVGTPERFVIAWTGTDPHHHINIAAFAP